jgi:hypothetical protein
MAEMPFDSQHPRILQVLGSVRRARAEIQHQTMPMHAPLISEILARRLHRLCRI